jgi:hypothetical protein
MIINAMDYNGAQPNIKICKFTWTDGYFNRQERVFKYT